MRQKLILDATKTDRELFEAMETGDHWPEAELIQVWAYLYRNSRLCIPSSWQATLAKFNDELMDIAGALCVANPMRAQVLAAHPGRESLRVYEQDAQSQR